jgi:hypothetical protein
MPYINIHLLKIGSLKSFLKIYRSQMEYCNTWDSNFLVYSKPLSRKSNKSKYVNQMITTCTTYMSKYQNEIGTLVGIGVNG